MGIEPGGDVVEPPLELRRLRTQRREVGHHPAQAAIMIAQPNGQRLLGEPAPIGLGTKFPGKLRLRGRR
jgi:hypothetical protein